MLQLTGKKRRATTAATIMCSILIPMSAGAVCGPTNPIDGLTELAVEQGCIVNTVPSSARTRLICETDDRYVLYWLPYLAVADVPDRDNCLAARGTYVNGMCYFIGDELTRELTADEIVMVNETYRSLEVYTRITPEQLIQPCAVDACIPIYTVNDEEYMRAPCPPAITPDLTDESYESLFELLESLVVAGEG